MRNITLSKTEYEQLKKQAEAYQKFAARCFELIIQDPVEETVADFRKTKLYSENFLDDLESGLRKSSYAKKYSTKTIKKRS
ncbi:hypothetical protein A3F08_01770 [Candidatus Berkelbacteria bacterium RIFCSPHIGHO2_12_FULL_36_9]|uniref:Uncharacterized protein n=1 Tax=Candidatus Berkelbacteria bacterium RIFCSPHIGHO2_12_FULL_36_9 TaxID=1797469 RepID=A0A1F5EDE1_9BACT|nr:MAG: hypothetical protein A3F08_01770 [Candidatus Berkelbacteria bacterium RIFCSPHIGHO2_12_FULL_36_9]